MCREYLEKQKALLLIVSPPTMVGLFYLEAHIWEMKDEELRGSSQPESIGILSVSCSKGSPLSWLTQ